MLRGLAVFLLIGASLVAVHKVGHYVVARFVVGVPAGKVRLVLLAVPQYVAFDDGQRWVGPIGFDDYLGAYRQYDPEESYLVAFLSAGVLAQTAAVVVCGGIALVAAVPFVGQAAVLGSGMLFGFHLFSDLGARLHLGSQTGDFSALFERSPAVTVALLVAVVVVHGLVYAQF